MPDPNFPTTTGLTLRAGRSEQRPYSSMLGLVLLGAVLLAGFALLLVAEAHGAPGWLFEAFLLVALVVVAVEFGVVIPAERRLVAFAETQERSRANAETVLVEALGHLSSGDLVRCSERGHGLPGELAPAFESATAALGVLAQQIQSSSIEVAGAASGVNQIASELASGSSQQAASVVEITAAMEELARTAFQIAENAASQAELAQRAEESGDVGAAAVEEAVAGVEEVKKRISGIADRADSLGARSKEIYRVLDLITEISQETHILSLNAAIEAAAAGEHGRRFSVVAEEVRRLAQRSQESVESVRALLDEFAGSIRATVVATEEGSKEASRVLERARAAASAIDELRRASGDTARVAREISLATQQQNAASDEVVLTLKEVSQVVQRMADGLKQFTSTADRLNHLGLQIQMLAQSFHLDTTHSLKHAAELWAREVERRAGNWEAIDRLLPELLVQRGYIEFLYFTDEVAGQLSSAANYELLGSRDVPESVLRGTGFADRPWFRSAVKAGRAVITTVYPSLISGEPIFTVAAPVYEDGRLAGILAFDININSWTKI
ncbi:MAG TPA: methyl-accepting chemotaxis protein [Thermoanaerobaculia bacterium]|jgi:methyl-accepting chemotaxis protein|nr:methyl-accepting chemotaxis protein [Thermoanaerobaculia bacterium]